MLLVRQQPPRRGEQEARGGVAHGPATLFLHTGSTNFIRPSMGSWVLHGLGTDNEDLPGFVSIAPSICNARQ